MVDSKPSVARLVAAYDRGDEKHKEIYEDLADE